MKKYYLVLSTGFAMFCMFFGSGNLVFPLVVGQESHGHFALAAFGIFLTGVVVPFLGVLGMMLFQGNTNDFFRPFGKSATFWFPLLALSLMGPFGVLARCITVAHGSLMRLIPNLPLTITSIAFCILIFLLTLKKNRIVPTLGLILTPFLLISLMAIVILGFKNAELPLPTGDAFEAFQNGILQGYQTMDLLAAFFFSTFIIRHLESHAQAKLNTSSLIKVFLKSALVGGGLLASVYIALVFLASMYSSSLIDVAPEQMLGAIADQVLGKLASPIVCTAVVLACLTTAIVLAVLFADFLQKEVTSDKISNKQAMLVTLTIAFFISTLEFAGIAKFLGPIMELIYPALITLTLVNIGHKLWGIKNTPWPAAATLLAKLGLTLG